MVPMDYEAITVSNTALPLTAGKLIQTGAAFAGMKQARKAMVSVETDQVRFTIDGTNTPTAAVGHLLNNGDYLILNSIEELQRFLVIRVTNDASVKVTYYYG
jgi:hypothetical protein